jgi:hypothetical protein
MPRGFIAFKIFQLVISVAILGLAAYGIYFFSSNGVDLTMFSVSEHHLLLMLSLTVQAIISIIITIYTIVAMTGNLVIYNYWAILGLDILLIVFWIISFSLVAARIAPYFGDVNTTAPCSYVYDYTYYYKRAVHLTKRDTCVST